MRIKSARLKLMFGVVCLAAPPILWLLGGGGLTITVTNRTLDPITNVRFAHNHGVVEVERIEPGRSARVWIRRPTNWPWESDTRVRLTFNVRSAAARPFEVGYESGGLLGRSAEYTIKRDHAGGVDVFAEVGAWSSVNYARVLRMIAAGQIPNLSSAWIQRVHGVGECVIDPPKTTRDRLIELIAVIVERFRSARETNNAATDSRPLARLPVADETTAARDVRSIIRYR